MLALLIISATGPRVERHVWPAARGLEIDWEWRDGRRSILVARMHISKRDCEYAGLFARSGVQDLTVSPIREVGSRPSGEFEVYNVTLTAIGGDIVEPVVISVAHRCQPLWVSRSVLFRLDVD